MAENRGDGGGTISIPAGRFLYSFAEPVVRSTGGNLIDPVFNCSMAREDDDNREIPRNVTRSADLISAFNFGIEISTDARFETQFRESFNDGVVPVQSTTNSPIADHKSNATNFQSHSHSVSCLSNPFMLQVNGGGMCSNGRGKQLSAATDREARVLRYREKRKKRKFEKKIRYASRKACAEMRPRIKGRFAKRPESMTVLDVDRWWFTTECTAKTYGAGEEYGVVPSL